MAQIRVRNVDDELMDWFQRRADRLGQSCEQLARAVIEREARFETGWEQFQTRAQRLRESMQRKTGDQTDSAADIRRDRQR